MGKEVCDRSFYDRTYFDPPDGSPTKSKYPRYVDGRRYYLPLAAAISGKLLGKRIVLQKESLVLDIGCAKGFLVKAFNRFPFVKAFGVDFSDYATQNRPKEAGGGKILLGDARSLPFATGKVDLCVSMDVLEHLNEAGINQVVSETFRVLKPGGHFFTLIAVGESAENDFDQSHVTIVPSSWWIRKFENQGFHQVNILPLLAAARMASPVLEAGHTLSRPGVLVFQK